MKVAKKRFIPIDILRGLAVVLMIFFNNPGSWKYRYSFLEHASWEGFSYPDIVFPIFLFCMGFSMFFSLSKFENFNFAFFKKILIRSCILIFIGLVIRFFTTFFQYIYDGKNSSESFHETLDNLRFCGVFQRIGLCFFCSVIIIMVCKKEIKKLIVVCICMLASYALLLELGNGYSFSYNNIINKIDTKIIPVNHLMNNSENGIKYAIDPEGIVSSISSIAHVIIGYIFAIYIFDVKSSVEKSIDYKIDSKNNITVYARIVKLMVLGFALVLVGWCLLPIIPIGKKFWSVTYVFITCGISSCMLGLIYWLHNLYTNNKKKVVSFKNRKTTNEVNAVDILTRDVCFRIYIFFKSFGSNALFCYITSTVLGMIIGYLPYEKDGNSYISLQDAFMQILYKIFREENNASFFYALLFVAVNYIIAKILYKKRIFIKI